MNNIEIKQDIKMEQIGDNLNNKEENHESKENNYQKSLVLING